MSRAYMRDLHIQCEMPGCKDKATKIVYRSMLNIDGRYCFFHAKKALAFLKDQEKEKRERKRA